MRFSLLLVFLITNCFVITGQEVAFINEIHYDNEGTDVGEFVEVAIVKGTTDLSAYEILLINGSNNDYYRSNTLDNFVLGSSDPTLDYYFWEVSGIQNGPSDGVVLTYNGNVIGSIAYEGSFVYYGTSYLEDIGIEETNSTPLGHSLQRNSIGEWVGPIPNTMGQRNNGLCITNHNAISDGSVIQSYQASNKLTSALYVPLAGRVLLAATEIELAAPFSAEVGGILYLYSHGCQDALQGN